MNERELKVFLDKKVAEYNTPGFIANDPVCIPHAYSKKQDQEIMGFFAATLAWGQRVTIIRNCEKLGKLMDGAPHDFILNHTAEELKPFLGFVHRTFNDTDLLYFLSFFQWYYRHHQSLEEAFTQFITPADTDTGKALTGFHDFFFSLEHVPHRTRKHVATPARKSACKRLNMFLRWMVRADKNGVDLGLWKKIQPAQLICPLDVHVHRVANGLGLIRRKDADWQTALELTGMLRNFDPLDPVRYDYALFGLGVEERY